MNKELFKALANARQYDFSDKAVITEEKKEKCPKCNNDPCTCEKDKEEEVTEDITTKSGNVGYQGNSSNFNAVKNDGIDGKNGERIMEKGNGNNYKRYKSAGIDSISPNEEVEEEKDDKAKEDEAYADNQYNSERRADRLANKRFAKGDDKGGHRAQNYAEKKSDNHWDAHNRETVKNGVHKDVDTKASIKKAIARHKAKCEEAQSEANFNQPVSEEHWSNDADTRSQEKKSDIVKSIKRLSDKKRDAQLANKKEEVEEETIKPLTDIPQNINGEPIKKTSVPSGDDKKAIKTNPEPKCSKEDVCKAVARVGKAAGKMPQSCSEEQSFNNDSSEDLGESVHKAYLADRASGIAKSRANASCYFTKVGNRQSAKRNANTAAVASKLSKKWSSEEVDESKTNLKGAYELNRDRHQVKSQAYKDAANSLNHGKPRQQLIKDAIKERKMANQADRHVKKYEEVDDHKKLNEDQDYDDYIAYLKKANCLPKDFEMPGKDA